MESSTRFGLVGRAGVVDHDGVGDIVAYLGFLIAILGDRDARLEQVDRVPIAGGNVVREAIRMVQHIHRVDQRVAVASLNRAGDAERAFLFEGQHIAAGAGIGRQSPITLS
jgi:hypothetical protein